MFSPHTIYFVHCIVWYCAFLVGMHAKEANVLTITRNVTKNVLISFTLSFYVVRLSQYFTSANTTNHIVSLYAFGLDSVTFLSSLECIILA